MSRTVGSILSDFGLQLLLLDKTGVTQEMPSLTDRVSAYNHIIDSFGGFLNATINLTLTKTVAEWLFDNCIGKQVKLVCNAGRSAWEGFINQVTLKDGGVTETRGPLLDACNLLWATCSPMIYTEDPPTAGSEVLLPYVSDTQSIEKYGIIEKVLAMGQCSEAMAGYAQTVALQDMAYPRTSGQVSFAGDVIDVTLDCVGLIYWLFAYIYDLQVAGSTTASAKIIAILTAEANNYLSTDYTKIYTNAVPVGSQEKQHRYAADVIKEIVALGDNTTAGLRTLFGVYDNKQAVYAAAPTTIEYEHHLSWNNKSINNYLSGTQVSPWLVRPGKWLMVPDFQPNIPPVTDLTKDPRTKFIESVKYTAPLSLDLSGGKLDRLSTLIARITYSQGMAGGG
jgi:hypothetical protein